MTITIINGTNRTGNKTINLSKKFVKIVEKKGLRTNLITLDNFKELFTEEYVNLLSGTPEQIKDLQMIHESNIVIFVVPTYHHGITSSLKNFFDIVNDKTIWNNKIFGLVSSNNGSDAINQTRTILNGILSYNKAFSFIAPKQVILNLHNIDENRASEYIDYLAEFTNKVKFTS